MRAFVMLLFLSVAGTCYAQDPLESLNSVEDTLNTMERTLKTQAVSISRSAVGNAALSFDKEIYFSSGAPLGAASWIRVRPCSKEGDVPAPEPENCSAQAEEPGAGATYLWKSRPALPGDLRVGVMVVAQDKANGAWFLARITDTSQLESGYLTISAPFRAQLKGLRIVEE